MRIALPPDVELPAPVHAREHSTEDAVAQVV